MREDKKKRVIIGEIVTTQKGAGFIDMPEIAHGKDKNGKKARDDSDSIYFEPGSLNTAMNGDKVEALFEEKRIEGKIGKLGKVVRVISRARDSFVGTVKLKDGKTVAALDDRKAYFDFDIEKPAKEDDKVLIKFLYWKDPKRNPVGEVIKILGKKGLNDVEMESIVLEKGFAVGFPPEVEKEAEKAAREGKSVSAEEIAKRRDMRKTLTFTIDPYDAKDFDDAVSFRELTDSESAKFKAHGKLYEIGVHIADVSHYVRPHTALDKEALKRGCSVYLVDRTIPMLPEALSNDACSLNPREDKLSFSAVFVMDGKAVIHDRWFGKTVMNSAHRFTYETAQTAIDGDASKIAAYSNGIQSNESALAAMKYSGELRTLNDIAKILQKEKFSKGAIDFDQEEVKFQLDGKGKPVGVYVKERLDTHKMVEEYMLLANREVARFIFDSVKKDGRKNAASIYRIHDSPDREKMVHLASFVKALGYTLRLNKDGTVSARDLNALLDEIEDTPHEALISTAVIRSMQKAVYSTTNIGHFGLAFDYYTHFTSPIRRYPDLLVHRVLEKHLKNEPFGDRDLAAFQKIADSSTDREIDAAEAERASRKLKQVEYMSEKVGQLFEGTISGVTKWGIYVEESQTKSEGMIGFRNLGDDYYVLDERTYSVVGEKTGKKFTLGDKIKFKVMAADLDKKTLDYALA